MTTDADVGEMVRIARESQGMSQTGLAKAMRPYCKWFQTTVARIESGERPLRYLEALALRNVIPFSEGGSVANYYKGALEMVREFIEKEIERHE